MPDSDSVDILMATCNGARFLEEQVASILDQTHGDLHLRIKDDASDDTTPELLIELKNRHPERITLEPGSETRLGAATNFGSLLDQTTATYIMFADQDDVWLPEKVSKTLSLMKALEAKHGRHTPVLVHTDLRVVSEDLTLIDDSLWTYQNLVQERLTSLNRLLVQNGITGCTVMMNAALATRCAGGVPRSAIMHDWWIGLVAAAFGVVGFLPEGTLLYRQHGRNNTGAKAWSLPHICRRTVATFVDDDIPRSLRKTQEQARAFLMHYGDYLSKENLEVVNAYAQLPALSWLGRRRQILKHDFLKCDPVRSLALLLRG